MRFGGWRGFSTRCLGSAASSQNGMKKSSQPRHTPKLAPPEYRTKRISCARQYTIARTMLLSSEKKPASPPRRYTSVRSNRSLISRYRRRSMRVPVTPSARGSWADVRHRRSGEEPDAGWRRVSAILSAGAPSPECGGSLRLQAHVLQRGRPGIRIDQHQARFRDAGPDAARPDELVERAEARAVVEHLLDLVERGLALHAVDLARLLLE